MLPDCRHDISYNEDYLKKDDSAIIEGFDTAVEQVKAFFSNLPTTHSTKLLKWLESKRNEAITSMIDNMESSEYERNKEKAIEDIKLNKTKELYNTRYYIATGKKISKIA